MLSIRKKKEQKTDGLKDIKTWYAFETNRIKSNQAISGYEYKCNCQNECVILERFCKTNIWLQQIYQNFITENWM